VRPHTVRRPRLALGDGAATRVSFFGTGGGAIIEELSAKNTIDQGTIPESTNEYIVKANLAFARYCYYQYCMVYGIQKKVGGGGRILPKSRAIVLQTCGQCSRAG